MPNPPENDLYGGVLTGQKQMQSLCQFSDIVTISQHILKFAPIVLFIPELSTADALSH